MGKKGGEEGKERGEGRRRGRERKGGGGRKGRKRRREEREGAWRIDKVAPVINCSMASLGSGD